MGRAGSLRFGVSEALPAALPSDVRKGYAFPAELSLIQSGHAQSGA
jgi:hypothetical protein